MPVNKDFAKLQKEFLSFQRKFNGKTVRIKLVAEDKSRDIQAKRVDELLQDALDAHHQYEDDIRARFPGIGPLAETPKQRFLKELTRKGARDIFISKTQFRNLKELDSFIGRLRKSGI